MSCRKSVLFNNGKVWTKKDKDFNVMMGAQDGAEIAELTGIYLLKQVNDYLASLGEKSEAGLYRDDGLIYLEHAIGPLISKIEKALHRIFKQNQLEISMEQKGYTVNFLGVTLSTDGSHKPYKKPNNSLKYVNKAWNHPPCIPRNIRSSIEKRLNTISSSEVEFNEAKADYERALGNDGYSAEQKYDAEHNRATRTSRKRKRRIVWYNPPFSKNVATSIGREFFKLLQLHFPKQHPFHCIFNKNTVKLSYSCTTNMDNIVKAHSAKILSKDENHGDAKDYNCRDRTACPVANKCLTTNVVYKATAKYEDKTQYYVGMTENSFKTRYTQHKSLIKHTKNRNQTELSSLIWSLADKGTDYKLTWDIIDRARTYRPGKRTCNLCMSEKFHILVGTNLINKKTELLNKCPHRRKFLVRNHKP